MTRTGLFLLGILMPACAAAQERVDSPTVSVDASATIERAPDRAVLVLAVESEAAEAQAASSANAETIGRVIAALRQTGLTGPAVRTLSVRLMPVYAPASPDRQQAPRIVAYRAINTVQVTIDSIPRVGPVIDAAIGAGANRVAGLSFELRDPESARLEALDSAVARARREAETVARAAGHRLGPPVEIRVGPGGEPPRPMMYAERAVAMAQAADTPVEEGTLEITATVHVVFRLIPQ